jgi:GxxExxY protein
VLSNGRSIPEAESDIDDLSDVTDDTTVLSPGRTGSSSAGSVSSSVSTSTSTSALGSASGNPYASVSAATPTQAAVVSLSPPAPLPASPPVVAQPTLALTSTGPSLEAIQQVVQSTMHSMFSKSTFSQAPCDKLRTKQLMVKILECANDVFEKLGRGFQETVYHRGLEAKLRDAGIVYDSEVAVPYILDGHTVGYGRADMVVERSVVVELKSVASLAAESERQQLRIYLRYLNMRNGLIINFRQALPTATSDPVEFTDTVSSKLNYICVFDNEIITL